MAMPSRSQRKVKSQRGQEKHRGHKNKRDEESQMVAVDLSASESSGSIAPPLPSSPPPPPGRYVNSSRKVMIGAVCDSADEVSDITEDEAMPCMRRDQLPEPRIMTTRHSTYMTNNSATTAHTAQSIVDQHQQETKHMYRSPVERRRQRIKSSTDYETIKNQAPILHHEIKPPAVHPGYRSPDVRHTGNKETTITQGNLSMERKLPRYQRSRSNLEASRAPSVKDLIERQRSRSPDDIFPPTRYRKSSFRAPEEQQSELQYLVEQKQHRYRKISERNQVRSPGQFSQASDEVGSINSPQQERVHSKDPRPRPRAKSPAEWAQKQSIDQDRDTPDSRSTPVDYQSQSEPDEELQEVKRSGIVGKLLMKIEKTTEPSSSLSAFRPVSAPKPPANNSSQSTKRIKRPASADPLKQRSHLGNVYGGQGDSLGNNIDKQNKSVSRSTATLNLVVPKRRAITPTSIQHGYQANGHGPPSPLNFMSAPGCPESPSSFAIDRVVGNHALLLCWKPPPLDFLARSNGNQVLGYKIMCNGQPCHQASDPHKSKAIIENMDISQSCVLSIQTVATDGQVSPSIHAHFPGIRPGQHTQQRSSSLSDRHTPMLNMDFAEREKRLFLAVYDYLPSQHSPQDFTGRELVLAEGDLVLVFGHARPDGFYYGEVNGQRGLVPASFVQEIPKSAQHTLNNNYGH